ncbi:MAG: hypothetical protein P8Y93_10440, partial [Acidobacteriota bacterium]
LVYATVTGEGTAAFSRIYNLEKDGTTSGQGVPAIRLTSSTQVTEFILPMVQSSPGGFRTNVGFAQTSSGTYAVEVSIYSADGEQLATRRYRIVSAWRQINNVFENMGIGNLTVEGGWIRVRLVKGSPAYWTTYASVIDDQTNDPTYVLPVVP